MPAACFKSVDPLRGLSRHSILRAYGCYLRWVYVGSHSRESPGLTAALKSSLRITILSCFLKEDMVHASGYSRFVRKT